MPVPVPFQGGFSGLPDREDLTGFSIGARVESRDDGGMPRLWTVRTANPAQTMAYLRDENGIWQRLPNVFFLVIPKGCPVECRTI